MDQLDQVQLAFDDVVIDLAGHRLWRGGVEQALEPKAFAVLTLLAHKPGQVLTRDEILDAVWGHRHVSPGVLYRVMTLLRHALGEHAHAARYLHTLHGVGYRFDAAVARLKATPDVTPQAGTAAFRAIPPATEGRPEPSAAERLSKRTLQRRSTDRAGLDMRGRTVWFRVLLLFALLVLLGWRLW